MRTRYHYRDGALERIEMCFDDVGPLPAESPQPGPDPVAAQPTRVVVDAPPADPLDEAPADGQEADGSGPLTDASETGRPVSRLRRAVGTYAVTERIGMGTVRGAKMGIWGAVGEAAGYGVDNLTKIGLPGGTGFAVGCVLYAVNRAVFPDGKVL